MNFFESYARAVVRNFSLAGRSWSRTELNHRVALIPPADFWIVKRKMQSSEIFVIGPEGSLGHYMNQTFFEYLEEEHDFMPLPALIWGNRLRNLGDWQEYCDLESYLDSIRLMPWLSFRNIVGQIDGCDVFVGDVRVMFKSGFAM